MFQENTQASRQRKVCGKVTIQGVSELIAVYREKKKMISNGKKMGNICTLLQLVIEISTICYNTYLATKLDSLTLWNMPGISRTLQTATDMRDTPYHCPYSRTPYFPLQPRQRNTFRDKSGDRGGLDISPIRTEIQVHSVLYNVMRSFRGPFLFYVRSTFLLLLLLFSTFLPNLNDQFQNILLLNMYFFNFKSNKLRRQK